MTGEGRAAQQRAIKENPAGAGFFYQRRNLALWLSYNVFDTFNFDFYATVRRQAVD